ncbi:MAG: RraA family protein [Bryobacteraceae bacterium]|jgi:regulator of RNase E activity RraA
MNKGILKSIIVKLLIAGSVFGTSTVLAQIKQTKEQIVFYTSAWQGERFPDGRPKVADNLLVRALGVSIEDVWDYLRGQGYVNQFETGWQALHIDKPFAGRALTAQFMPQRPDMAAAVGAEGRAEGRVSGTNSWVINELQMGDTMVADGYGKIVEGTLIGSNLGSGIAAHTHSGFIFNAGIRDAEENRETVNLNGFYRGYDPSAWQQMQLTGINVPVRIGRAVVLPGDLVLAKQDGVIFIPAALAATVIAKAEFTNLQDSFNFELNRQGKNGAEFEGGWTAEKYAAFAKWIDAHPENLKMTRAEFDALLAQATAPRGNGGAAGGRGGRGGRGGGQQ